MYVGVKSDAKDLGVGENLTVKKYDVPREKIDYVQHSVFKTFFYLVGFILY